MQLQSFLKKHPAINHAEAIKTICNPLTKLDLIYFSHAHINEREEMSCLASNPQFFELYFNKGYQNFDLHMADTQPHEQYIIWDTIERKKQTKNMHQDFMSFNQGHTFSIVINNGNTKDYYHFATKLGNESINSFYLQNIDSLKKFILYFREKVSRCKELASAYDLKFQLTKNPGGYLINEPLPEFTVQNLQEQISIERIYLNNTKAYLTKRELDCLHWLAQGKTAEETAILLSIALRTVKAHISNVKEKLDCHTQFQLGMAYEKLKTFVGNS